MSLVVLVVFVSPKTTLSFSPCVTRAVLSFLKIHPEEISLWSTSSCLLASVPACHVCTYESRHVCYLYFDLFLLQFNFFPLIKKTNKVSCVNWKDLQFTSIFLCSFIDLRGCGVCTCAEVRGQHYLRVISSLLPCDSWTPAQWLALQQAPSPTQPPQHFSKQVLHLPVCVCGGQKELHGRLVVGTLLPEPPC